MTAFFFINLQYFYFFVFLHTYTSQHPSSTMEVYKSSSQALTRSGGLIDANGHLRKLQVLNSQASRNWI